jgi:hypothetical protein
VHSAGVCNERLTPHGDGIGQGPPPGQADRSLADKMGFEDFSEEISTCRISRPHVSPGSFVGLRAFRAGLQILGTELRSGAWFAGGLPKDRLLQADA